MNKTRFNPSIKILTKEEVQLDEYSLTFYVSENTGLLIDVVDSKTGIHNSIEGFLKHWDDANDIREDLLPMIDLVVNGYSRNEFISSDISCSYIEQEKTFFIHESNIIEGKFAARNNSSRNMPTSKFKAIILKWLDFLESQKS